MCTVVAPAIGALCAASTTGATTVGPDAFVAGAGSTEIDAVVVEHPPATAQPAPVHDAVFVIVTPAGTDADTATLNDRSAVAPAAKPAPTVHVTEPPDTTTVHDGVVDPDSEPQLAEPATIVVPAGAESRTTVGLTVAAVPTFGTANVNVTSEPEPATTLVGDADFTTVPIFGAPVTVVGVVTVTGQPPAVVHPGPDHIAVFVIVAPTAVDAANVTSNVRSAFAPAANPAAIVHVIELPDTDTEHEPAPDDARPPQLADPGTYTVPAGTVSVTTDADVVAAEPVFCPDNVYVIGAVEPTTIDVGLPVFVHTNDADGTGVGGGGDDTPVVVPGNVPVTPVFAPGNVPAACAEDPEAAPATPPTKPTVEPTAANITATALPQRQPRRNHRSDLANCRPAALPMSNVSLRTEASPRPVWRRPPLPPAGATRTVGHVINSTHDHHSPRYPPSMNNEGQTHPSPIATDHQRLRLTSQRPTNFPGQPAFCGNSRPGPSSPPSALRRMLHATVRAPAGNARFEIATLRAQRPQDPCPR